MKKHAYFNIIIIKKYFHEYISVFWFIFLAYRKRENTNAKIGLFRIRILAHMPCWPPRSFYAKIVEIICPKWNAYKLLYKL